MLPQKPILSSDDDIIAQKAKEKLSLRDDISMSSSDESDSGNEDDWMDVDAYDGDEQEKTTIISLVDDKTFDNVTKMLAYCKEKTGLDFLEIRHRLELDFMGCIKLVNLIRSKTRDNARLPSPITATDLEHDDLMMPVLEDDAFIMSLEDLPELMRGNSSALPQPDELARKNAELQEELVRMQQQFMLYRESVAATLDKRWGIVGESSSTIAVGSAAAGSSKTPGAQEPSMKDIMKKEISGSQENENDYFDSYAGLEIHETMLKDTVRTEGYRDFIYNNKALFVGKTILDVGCGTGILSMFAAKAGAARVIAVDNSDIVKMARTNVSANKLDGIITVIQGKMEEVALPVDKVDLIISEWMGYCLTYEAMLPSVLWARDRYLIHDGLMVPSHATLRLAPVSSTRYVEESIRWWSDVYGFDMGALPKARKEHVVVTALAEGDVAGDAVPFRLLDLHTIKTAELEFSSNFETRLERGIVGFEGWAVWFDIFFATGRDEVVNPEDIPAIWAKSGADRVAFTTGPEGKTTHWEQGLLIVKDQTAKEYEEGDDFIGTVEFKHTSGNKRHLDITIKWETRVEGKKEQVWYLG